MSRAKKQASVTVIPPSQDRSQRGKVHLDNLDVFAGIGLGWRASGRIGANEYVALFRRVAIAEHRRRLARRSPVPGLLSQFTFGGLKGDLAVFDEASWQFPHDSLGSGAELAHKYGALRVVRARTHTTGFWASTSKCFSS